MLIIANTAREMPANLAPRDAKKPRRNMFDLAISGK
jgi:hypothetical protein